MRQLVRLSGLAIVLAIACCASPALSDTIGINGTDRTFTARFPNKKPAPLVIALHGNTQTGADMATRTSWPEIARRDGFGVVFPDGLSRAWADFRPNSNRAGLVRLIEKFIADGTTDPRHIYITGVSNGGAMTMTMICARADLFAAAASVIINLTDASADACHPSRPVPMLMMNGTADPLIPFEGGRGTNRFAAAGFWSTAKTLAFWRRANGCEAQDAAVIDLEDHDQNDQTTVTRVESHCPPGRNVVLDRSVDAANSSDRG